MSGSSACLIPSGGRNRSKGRRGDESATEFARWIIADWGLAEQLGGSLPSPIEKAYLHTLSQKDNILLRPLRRRASGTGQAIGRRSVTGGAARPIVGFALLAQPLRFLGCAPVGRLGTVAGQGVEQLAVGVGNRVVHHGAGRGEGPPWWSGSAVRCRGLLPAAGLRLVRRLNRLAIRVRPGSQRGRCRRLDFGDQLAEGHDRQRLVGVDVGFVGGRFRSAGQMLRAIAITKLGPIDKS